MEEYLIKVQIELNAADWEIEDGDYSVEFEDERDDDEIHPAEKPSDWRA